MVAVFCKGLDEFCEGLAGGTGCINLAACAFAPATAARNAERLWADACDALSAVTNAATLAPRNSCLRNWLLFCDLLKLPIRMSRLRGESINYLCEFGDGSVVGR